MKKLFLIAALMFASFGAFADDFDEFVAEARKSLASEGVKVRSDKAERTVFFDINFPIESSQVTPEVLAEMKQILIKPVKSDPQAVAELQALKVTLVYNIISTDGKVFKITVRSSDL